MCALTPGTGERAGVVLFSQWNEFCRLREAVLDSGDTESIHDLRVASRRMRATVGLFAPFIEGKSVRGISKKLRSVTRELGHLRNIDEALIYLTELPTPLPVMNRMLHAARVQEMSAVTAVLERFPREKTDRLIRNAVAELAGVAPDDQGLPVHLSQTSVRRFQAVHDLLLPATVPDSVETRHRLRIAIKKWRYLLETLGLVCRHDYSATLEMLKEYQTLLGSLNDMIEFGALCGSLGAPRDETGVVMPLLERDSALYLARFIETVSSRPLQYTFKQ